MNEVDRVAALEAERLAIVNELRVGGLDDAAGALAALPLPRSAGWVTAWLVATCSVQHRVERWIQLVPVGTGATAEREANLRRIGQELAQLSERASALMVAVNQLVSVEGA